MSKRLYKSRTKKNISGVCGGLEDYFNLDVTIIRLVWVLITFASGIFPGVLAYVAAALIMPDEPTYDDHKIIYDEYKTPEQNEKGEEKE